MKKTNKPNFAQLAKEHIKLTAQANKLEKRLSQIREVFDKRVSGKASFDGYLVEKVKVASTRLISKDKAEKRLGLGFLKLHKLLQRVVSVRIVVKKVA